jgi:outer membrane murein-binding lipoprotein Lpp
MRLAALILCILVVAGCGSTASKQADDLQSLAAEGALLAHDAGEGDEWKPYRRAHVAELASEASSLQEQAKTRELTALARTIASDLDRLEHADRDEAKRLERRLDNAAKRAERLA